VERQELLLVVQEVQGLTVQAGAGAVVILLIQYKAEQVA
jgi:hypothetical protein